MRWILLCSQRLKALLPTLLIWIHIFLYIVDNTEKIYHSWSVWGLFCVHYSEDIACLTLTINFSSISDDKYRSIDFRCFDLLIVESEGRQKRPNYRIYQVEWKRAESSAFYHAGVPFILKVIGLSNWLRLSAAGCNSEKQLVYVQTQQRSHEPINSNSWVNCIA